MLDPGERDELRRAMKVIRIVWAAMLLSLGVYLFVCHRLAAQLPPAKAPGIAPTMRAVLLAMAGIELIAIHYLRRLILKGGPGARNRTAMRPGSGTMAHPAAGRYLIATLVSAAIAESIGIYGVVQFLSFAEFRTLYLFVGIAAAAMVHFRPKSDELETLAAALNAVVGEAQHVPR